MSIDVRRPDEEQLRAAMEAAETAFASSLEEHDWERERVSLPASRAHVAFDGDRAVGLAGAYAFELTVPGGTVPCAGVTWVGVLPTHRRRGILRRLMARELEDIRAWGEPVAALWASEASIYGRFGYGIAAPGVRMEAQSARFELRDDPGPTGTWRLLTAEEAFPICASVYEALRRERTGMLSRTEHWWRAHRLADRESWRRGASQKFYAVLELEGEASAYAVYRVKEEWERGFPKGTVRVQEAFATTPRAERELWRYLFGIDLTTTVDVWALDPASPLFLMARDPRALHLQLGDGLWLRLVNVEEALRARTYGEAPPLVLRVHDELCPWNEGAYRVGGLVERTDDEADLELDVADLASAYLGAFDFLRLAGAERVRELTPGALARASHLFRTLQPPYCPEVF